MYKTIDLFAGAGGLSLGFVQTKKYKIEAAFENNRDMQMTYKKNHPDTDVFGDVKTADYNSINEKYGPIDVVIGGPPCQGFSNANRQRNHVVNQNNALVKQYVRAIVELKPKAFVMENVSMLKSEVHRFFLTPEDLPLIQSGALKTEVTHLPLLDEKFYFEEAEQIVKDNDEIARYIWPEKDYNALNIVFKVSKNKIKLEKTLERHKRELQLIAGKYVNSQDEGYISQYSKKAFSALMQFYAETTTDTTGKLMSTDDLISAIEPAIRYQRMLSKAREIYSNNLIVDSYAMYRGNFTAVIRSFPVFDYLKAKLGQTDGYAINSGILSAANFGAPQKRKRFIIMGIRKDISNKVELPEGSFTEDSYRTVEDAIADLEDVPTVCNLQDDKGTALEEKNNLSPLASQLRNSPVLYNHIVTNTGENAMRRFKALKQGDNFHKLDKSLVSNTYTNADRTQNTIYLRLNYDAPSGTVLNVRKSMWVHPTLDRAISVREAARLQTFPDSFIFCGTKDKQYQQVGNAVPPVLAYAIAKCLAEQLEGTFNKKR
jgi:DNA (cytosine-5)-methyltransferase 1